MTTLQTTPPRSHVLDRPGSADAVAAAWLLGYSGATRAAYASDLADFAAWLDRAGLRPFDATRAAIEAYARELELARRSAATVARRLASLSGFYSYAVDEGLIGRSPVARVRRPRVPEDSPRLGLDRAQLGAFLDVAERSSARDGALAMLLGLSGLRISEALGADVADLGQERGHRVLSVVRKGGRRVWLPLAPRTCEAIDRMLGGRSDGPLFVTRSGARMDRQAAGKVVGRLARSAGVEHRVSPHSLRHAFVTAALDAGASLRDVQDAAGHADPRTTRRYDRARGALDRNPTYAVAAYVAG